ncbi:diaminopimelate decarboxylase [Candidatus Pelagibacter sp. RS39]|uniref:diaminopimelate decarboxylase n=1 Tax=Candidatus Pelagibacter sp. RS39 TaxID=1977864 RepID=UPI000A15307F|nr:diaminopimelate decarboxylase [Candidatus Pelagibacter sp. RS39]ARJ47360.1 diaminopimelate decarboxylase [Candidatus Pelagibacter sp. RS39]
MKYINKRLTMEKVNFQRIAKKFGTPFYCYSYSKLKENVSNFKKNFKSFSPLICFAVKSNTNVNLIREIKKFGLGADVVSLGELMMAIKAGIKPNKIVFSGVGKTSSELNFAINKKILLINAESLSEIMEINRLAKLKNKKVRVGVRLNPNTDAKTLNQISTGKKENKFGVNKNTFHKIVDFCKSSKNIDLKCLSVHIGSQILDHRPYGKMLKAVSHILDKTNHQFEFIDLGGGMGINYSDKNKELNYKKYNTAINNFLKKHKVKIIFEPGRSIIGNTGILISKVIYIKDSGRKKFIILDAAMNDLMRPALYGAFHMTLPVIKSSKISNKPYEFVGPICESTDKFITLKKFQKLEENDLIAICDVGAYGMSLSSNYNLRPKPIELLIKGSKINVIRKRQKYTEII